MEKYIYIVRENSDFNEGNGVMIERKVFSNIENARKFIKSKRGIMGGKQYCHYQMNELLQGRELWDGYDIISMKVEEN